jgi:hypothetical protein
MTDKRFYVNDIYNGNCPKTCVSGGRPRDWANPERGFSPDRHTRQSDAAARRGWTTPRRLRLQDMTCIRPQYCDMFSAGLRGARVEGSVIHDCWPGGYAQLVTEK